MSASGSRIRASLSDGLSDETPNGSLPDQEGLSNMRALSTRWISLAHPGAGAHAGAGSPAAYGGRSPGKPGLAASPWSSNSAATSALTTASSTASTGPDRADQAILR